MINNLGFLIRGLVVFSLMWTIASCGDSKGGLVKNPGQSNQESNTPESSSSTTSTSSTSTTSSSSTSSSSSTTTTTLPENPITTTTTTTVTLPENPVPTTTTTTIIAPPSSSTSTTSSTTTTMPQACAPSGPSFGAPGSFTINSGATETRSNQVSLQLAREEAQMMKISNNQNCECGVWEPFSPTKAWTLTQLNQQAHISVQFKDLDNVTTPCISQSIRHDDQGPSINLALDSSNEYFSDSATKLSLNISDSGVGISSFACTANGQSYPCTNPMSITWAQLAIGSYEFIVQATDRLGNSSNQRVSWTITQRYRDITQNHEIKANNKVDILMVIDNSGSMQYEQQNMAQRMSTFMNQVKDLDYKIAITTTDPTHSTYGDGRFVSMKGLSNSYVVDRSLPLDQAQRVIGDTLQRSETGSGSEQGILVTYRAIERSLSTAASPNRDFFRSDAGFATILISDEDESATAPKNIPQNLVNFVKVTWPDKNFAFHSIITRPNDTNCKNTNGYAYGYKYAEMSSLTGLGTVGGAIIGDVCATDYGSQLAGIGQSVQQMNRVIDLDCAPVGDPRSAVGVTLNGSNYSEPYEVQGTKLVFTTNLPVGSYQLSYKCNK